MANFRSFLLLTFIAAPLAACASVGESGNGSGNSGGPSGGDDPGSSDKPDGSGDEQQQPDVNPGGAEPGEEEDDGCDPGCLFPVADHIDLDYVVWCEENVHLYIPKPSWAMAAIHGSRIMAHYTGDIRTSVSPNWFIATALKESYLGCDPDLPADTQHPEHQWVQRENSYGDGCFQITSPAVTDLSVLFSDHVPADHAGIVSNANFETAALTMAFFNAFAMVRACDYTGGESARDLLANMEDPLGQLKTFTIGYNQGLWNNSEFGKAIDSCANAPELLECVWAGAVPDYAYESGEVVNCPGGRYLGTSEALPYSHAIGHYVEELDGAAREGHCYDGAFTEDEALEYMHKVSRMFPKLETAAAETAVREAFASAAGGAETVTFQKGFPKVLEAIEAHQGELQDPWPGMEAQYGKDNPAQCDVIEPYLPDIDDTCESITQPPR
jgi:hypothetical protein